MQSNPSPTKPLTIAMVAGEASGDNLGASLVTAIKDIHSDAKFVGIGGPSMIAAGFESCTDMENLSVNGFVDPVLRLPQLIGTLRLVRDTILETGADCFVGIDSNFFNLLLAGMLKKKGVPTIQYVSPTVWAWREGRIKKIRRNVDLMMTLYPFENDIYEQHQIPVQFVGHPKASEIDPQEGDLNKHQARNELGLGEGFVVAILPGSRGSEVERSGQDFLDAARQLNDRVSCFVIPAANEKRMQQLRAMLDDYGDIANKVHLRLGESRKVLTASDLVLVNSGTATLEAMLLKKPMVMSYRVGRITYGIVSRLVKTNRFALPNILAEQDLVPEFIQNDAKPNSIAEAAIELMDVADQSELRTRFDAIHQRLIREPRVAAEAVLSVIEKE